jgi:small subunit ribosomal protein S20
MPNIKSAKKRMLQSERANKRNSAHKSRVRSTRKKFLADVEAKNIDAAKLSYSEFCSVLDKAAKADVIKKNTSVRSKRRGAEKLRALSAPAAPAAPAE